MPASGRNLVCRYCGAVLLVAIAVALRWAMPAALVDAHPFFLFFLAIVLSGHLGGSGPSLLALVLSLAAIEGLVLSAGAHPTYPYTRSHVAIAFLVVGIAVAILGGSLRAARGRAACSRRELSRANESRRAEREWLEITLASIADAVITTDPAGAVVFLNPAACRLTGWDLAEVAGRPLEQVFQAEPAEPRSRPFKALPPQVAGCRGHAGPSRGEVPLLARDGTVRSVEHHAAPIKDAQGNVKGFVLVFRDITERNRAEQALRESEQRFRTLADATPVLIWGSGPDRLCNYFNRQWLDFTGRTLEQETGEGWLHGVHAEDRSHCLETYTAAFDARQRFTIEYRLRRYDGEYRWVVDTGVPRLTPDGTFTGYIGSCLDITDRRQAEEELRDADRRKEEFLAVLSHELRNPLAPIQTALDLLERREPPRDGPDRELAMIRRQVRNLRRLVDDLLDISCISRGKVAIRKERIELAQTIAETVEAVHPVFVEHNQDLQVSMPAAPIPMRADAARMEQILYNLLLNASKSTPEGGRVWLAVAVAEGQVVIRVRDTGIGIEADVLPRVFDLFFQGERRLGLSHEGGGIGLSLARNLVELHGGTIEARSPGSEMGSEFVVHLPLGDTSGAEPRRDPPLAPRAVVRPLPAWRVLVVDDNVQAADSLGRLMSVVFGLEVRVVHSGGRALEAAASFLPNLVLLDLEMAGMDGYEVARRLHQRAAGAVPLIVAVTGWGHEEDRRRSRAAGLDGHLVKPVTVDDLGSLLADLAAAPVRRRPTGRASHLEHAGS